MNFKTKSEYTEHQFFTAHRELLAFFDASKISESLIAFLQLNHTVDEIKAAATNSSEYRKMLSVALVTLIDRGSLVPLADLNEDAEADLEDLRRLTGIGVEQLAPPLPPALTAAELLEAEVRNDFATLPGTKMREKRNSRRDYETMFQKIAGTLGSSATIHHNLGGQ